VIAINMLKKLIEVFRSTPETPEDIAAEAEAKQLQDQMETARLSQRAGSAGENYESGRAPK
jgi:hypothetical protein